MAKLRLRFECSPSMLEPVRPGAVFPDRALCLPTFSHFLIVNKTSYCTSHLSSPWTPRHGIPFQINSLSLSPFAEDSGDWACSQGEAEPCDPAAQRPSLPLFLSLFPITPLPFTADHDAGREICHGPCHGPEIHPVSTTPPGHMT